MLGEACMFVGVHVHPEQQFADVRYKRIAQRSNAKRAEKSNHGKSHSIVMGCYGIGVSRLIAAIIEQHLQVGYNRVLRSYG